MVVTRKFITDQEEKVASQVWITNMSERAEIEKWVIDQFSELENYGLSKPVIKRDHWTTSFDWLSMNIAIELELDWREFDPFMLIVRLEDHQLPQNYYVSNGKPCRFHLQKAIQERGWSVVSDEMKVLSANEKRGLKPKPSADNFKKRLLAYKVVLISCIDQVLADGESIFSA